MAATSHDPLHARRRLRLGNAAYTYLGLDAVQALPGADLGRLPISLKVLLENLLRHEDGEAVRIEDIAELAAWPSRRHSDRCVAFHPVRILMPDSSGIPLLADLAAMRDAMRGHGMDPETVNSVIPMDLVVDHSVIAEFTGGPDSAAKNLASEYAKNRERYSFLRWAEHAFRNLRVVPPGSGILHQVNLEYLGRPVRHEVVDGESWAYPDSLVGMDSHTPMINALGVFGWGVGGIEAGSAMLGEPITLQIPDVVGCRLMGRLPTGVTSMDVALNITERLRAHGVVGKVVEFIGDGVAGLALPDRATIANMAPEYGATMGYFPIDDETILYLAATGRDPGDVRLAEAYAKAQGLWASHTAAAAYSDTVDIELDRIQVSCAGPARPQDRRALSQVPRSFNDAFPGAANAGEAGDIYDSNRPLRHGDIVIAAIVSCTNTSNPVGMIGAGIMARNAAARGLRTKPWVKASMSPGSRVVADYLEAADLMRPLQQLGFFSAGFGCMTCGGGSGELLPQVGPVVDERNLTVAAVLSANRNFEGRTHPQVRATYLCSPALVVASGIAGSILIDMESEPLGFDRSGEPVFLKDIWPDPEELRDTISRTVNADVFRRRYSGVFEGDETWRALPAETGATFAWDPDSTYFCRPPYFEDVAAQIASVPDIIGARPLLVLGDGITTDHISPCSPIPLQSPAGRLLSACGVKVADLHNYEARRVNHHVMTRGAFSSSRLRNMLAPGVEGGFTRHMPSGETMTVFDAAMRYARDGVPLVMFAGADYGTGSSRDWAAKGTKLLGIRAVIAESFERIHRSNLIGMGVLPLQLPDGISCASLQVDGAAMIDLIGVDGAVTSRSLVNCRINRPNGAQTTLTLRCRIDTEREAQWFRHGGVLPFVLAKFMRSDPKRSALHRAEPLAP